MKITADSTGGVTVGVDKAHYAILTQDKEGSAPQYEEVVSLPNTKSIGISSNDSTQTGFYDNAPKVAATSKSEKNLTFTKSDFSNAEQEKLLGFHKTDDGITVEGGDSIAPYVAFGFRTLKSNGGYRYVWLLKGTFTVGEVNAATREQAVSLQDQSIKGVFITRICDNQIKIQIDSDDPDCPSDINETWFTVDTLNMLYLIKGQ